jgi:hypothetical protein
MSVHQRKDGRWIARFPEKALPDDPDQTRPYFGRGFESETAARPHNDSLSLLKHVTKPKAVGLQYNSNEPICRIVNGEAIDLWENGWIASDGLKEALKVTKIVVGSAVDTPELVQPEEVELFKQNAWAY